MSKSVAVIGAGIAGTAAAFSAVRAGKRVTLISKGAGASAMSGGAVDDRPWEALESACRALGAEASPALLSPETVAFSDALGLWTFQASRPMRLATLAGRIRMARGADRALLDLASLADGAQILVPRICRAAWDADALCDAFNADPYSKKRGFRFFALDTAVLRFTDEQRISDVDLAARHDTQERISWLQDSLKDALHQARERAQKDPAAILLGPWLGVHSAKAAALSEALSVPVGEALMGIGSPAGFRFEHARDRLLASLGVTRIPAEVAGLSQEGGRIRIQCAGDTGELFADAAVLSVGGTAGGGFLYVPPEVFAGEDLPARVQMPFGLSLKADLELCQGRGAVEIASSMYGPEMDLATWPALSKDSSLASVGLRTSGVRISGTLFAAGDCIAGRPRTVLEALLSGLEAGRQA